MPHGGEGPPEVLREGVAVELVRVGVAGDAHPPAEIGGDGDARDAGEVPVAQLVLAEPFAFRRVEPQGGQERVRRAAARKAASARSQ